MAFTGVNLVFGYAGARGVISKNASSGFPLLRIISSQYMTSAGTSMAVASGVNPLYGEPVARVRAAADSWVSFGSAPVATADGARDLIPAGETREYVVMPGDKMAWAAA